MQKLEAKIEVIEIKLSKLLRKASQLDKENKELVEENIKLKKELRETRESTQKESNMPDLFTRSSGNDINAIKKELDGYIAEVRECIDLLEN